jgi:hypothetical protein
MLSNTLIKYISLLAFTTLGFLVQASNKDIKLHWGGYVDLKFNYLTGKKLKERFWFTSADYSATYPNIKSEVQFMPGISGGGLLIIERSLVTKKRSLSIVSSIGLGYSATCYRNRWYGIYNYFNTQGRFDITLSTVRHELALPIEVGVKVKSISISAVHLMTVPIAQLSTYEYKIDGILSNYQVNRGVSENTKVGFQSYLNFSLGISVSYAFKIKAILLQPTVNYIFGYFNHESPSIGIAATRPAIRNDQVTVGIKICKL